MAQPLPAATAPPAGDDNGWVELFGAEALTAACALHAALPPLSAASRCRESRLLVTAAALAAWAAGGAWRAHDAVDVARLSAALRARLAPAGVVRPDTTRCREWDAIFGVVHACVSDARVASALLAGPLWPADANTRSAAADAAAAVLRDPDTALREARALVQRWASAYGCANVHQLHAAAQALVADSVVRGAPPPRYFRDDGKAALAARAAAAAGRCTSAFGVHLGWGAPLAAERSLGGATAAGVIGGAPLGLPPLAGAAAPASEQAAADASESEESEELAYASHRCGEEPDDSPVPDHVLSDAQGGPPPPQPVQEDPLRRDCADGNGSDGGAEREHERRLRRRAALRLRRRQQQEAAVAAAAEMHIDAIRRLVLRSIRAASIQRAEAYEAKLKQLQSLLDDHDEATRSKEESEGPAAPDAADGATLTAQLAAMAQRAESAEARVTQQELQIAELQRALRDAQHGKRNADECAAQLRGAVAIKREKLEEAISAAEAARAEAAREAAALDAARTCCVCMDAPAKMVYLPCRHLVVCEGCNVEVQEKAMDALPIVERKKLRRAQKLVMPPCPMCREVVLSVIGPIFHT